MLVFSHLQMWLSSHYECAYLLAKLSTLPLRLPAGLTHYHFVSDLAPLLALSSANNSNWLLTAHIYRS